MSEITTAPPSKAPPLFTLDLNENGGRLAPTRHDELIRWIHTEINFWSWLQQRHYGNHENYLRDSLSQINEAFNAAQQSQQQIQSNPLLSQQQLDFSRDRIQYAFQKRKLPHSSTPLAKRVDAYRKEAGDQAASYFIAVNISPASGQPQFQATEFAAWRGIFEGMQERFHIPQAVARGKKRRLNSPSISLGQRPSNS